MSESDERLPHPCLALGYRSGTQSNTTTARIENAISVMARLIAEEGELFLPIFRRLEQELDERRDQEGALRRALSIAAKDGLR
ncbi:hypothetical protein HNR46_003958 [Haloferula luteola]|uniref:Uncharacterized protein n=1 Tax=Haloferula luteola TaxID=595692 RepID=A0A840V617_9BACT|nr:hypothetical protein [Haloferula luteola]MBB5353697.1 hypothetical protein [Haloferula luteola]